MATEICAYCATATATEEDHVVARQFFPDDPRWRANLPKVPCCAACNRDKQRVEDGPAVWFQFGDGSEGATKVVAGRVPRTLAKNRRLLREIHEKTQEVWVAGPSGIVARRLALRLGKRELADAHRWFTLVLRGLFRFETGSTLPADHRIFLIKPETEQQYRHVLKLLPNTSTVATRAFGNGEFKYMFCRNAEQALTTWLVSFRSIDVAAITTGPKCPSVLTAALEAASWET
jgi:hypothetical protein